VLYKLTFYLLYITSSLHKFVTEVPCIFREPGMICCISTKYVGYIKQVAAVLVARGCIAMNKVEDIDCGQVSCLGIPRYYIRNVPLVVRVSWPPSNTLFIGPHESTPKLHLDQFGHFCTLVTNRQTRIQTMLLLCQ